MRRRCALLCRLLGGLALVALALLAFTPLANVVHRRTVHASIVGPADAIVVLGAAVSPDGLLDGPSLRRLLEGVRLSRRGLAPWLVILGSPNQGTIEAEVRATLARELGIDPATILTEPRGLTTQQEAERTAALLLPRGLKRILLVTGEYHLLRAQPVFRRVGFEVLPAAVREDSGASQEPGDRLGLAAKLTREWVARLYYKLQGRG
jgi:uncharacterized SAM-binding protein YcdF (DUF218 family)